MNRKHLVRPFEIKTLEGNGKFAGYLSVFGNKDTYGDVVEPGAFKASLAAWATKGRLPPVLWQHDSTEPIGLFTKMVEDLHGLYVDGQLLVESDPVAARAYAHLKAGSVSGMSIGYSVPTGGGQWDPQTATYRLKQIDLWEGSLVTFPANEEAQARVRSAASRCDAADVIGALRSLNREIAGDLGDALATAWLDCNRKLSELARRL
jgi:HK97 family phage prohead protease